MNLAFRQIKADIIMKKVRIILSLIIVVTLASSILAFTAERFNGQRVFNFTSVYVTFNTFYTRFVPAFLPSTPAKFITNTGLDQVHVFSTTGITTTAPIILTQLGGTATLTFPTYTATWVQNTFTTLIN